MHTLNNIKSKNGNTGVIIFQVLTSEPSSSGNTGVRSTDNRRARSRILKIVMRLRYQNNLLIMIKAFSGPLT